jgi:uncharacterized membrane protein YkoI
MKTTKLIAAVAVSASLAFGVAAQGHGKKEETVDMNSLPAEVQKTLKDKAADSEIIRVEKETKHGKTVYEGVVKKDGKEWDILVDASGKFLKQHESKEHKEKGEKY